MRNNKNHIDSELDNNNQVLFDIKMHKKHTKDLGLDIPNDYFSKSKTAILEKVSKQKEARFKMFSRDRIMWSVAATIVLIFALKVFMPNGLLSIDKIPTIVSDSIELLKNNNLAFSELDENNILITSLFVEDTEIDEFVTDYVLDELVYEEVLPN